MLLNFFKYQATGNDFIIIDDRERTFDINNNSLIQRLCHRKFGIGADGLILLRNEKDVDFKMLYFNADGYEGSMCGNGGRCATAFAHKLFPQKTEFQFMAYDGLHKSAVKSVYDDGFIVKLEMQQVEQPEIIGSDLLLNTGSPHYIKFVQDVALTDVNGEGKAIRNSGPFLRNGVNVNFVEINQQVLTMRTYERGVEDETLSCGTGATAAAIGAFWNKKIDTNSVDIHTRGGNLNVSFDASNNNIFTSVYLTGEATPVFEGKMHL
jgi:diaminopimelate epimerase